MQNLINDINYVEYSNKLEKILWEILFSSNGYTNLKSKVAIENVEKYLQKFDFELDKLNDKYQISQNDKLAKNLRLEFINQLKNHYNKEIINWLDLTFEEKVENILLKASLNKKNLTIIDISYNELFYLMKWYSKSKKLNENEVKLLIEKINKKFKNALRENFENLLPKQNGLKTNAAIYFKLWYVLRNSKDDFVKIDINSFIEDLTKEDYNYFQFAKNLVNNNEIAQLYDEIDLLNAALEIAELKSNDEKYNLLKQIKSDFKTFKAENKIIKEEDKIQIIKRRIAILKESKASKNNYKYFKTILLS